MTGYRQESVEIESAPSTPCVEDAEVSQDASGSMSLPYWVEASHNIYKVCTFLHYSTNIVREFNL